MTASRIEGTDSANQQSAVKEIETSISDLERQLNGASSEGSFYESIQKDLVSVQSSFSSLFGFIPPYQQKSLQSRLKAIESVLQRQNKDRSRNAGFAFRRREKPPSSSAVQVGPRDSISSPSVKPLSESGDQLDAKLNPNSVQISNSSDEKHVIERVTASGKDIFLSHLKGSSVLIYGPASTLRLSNLDDCTIISVPVQSSIFMTNCHRCTFVFACQQLRVHDSTNLDCYVHVQSGGIIENCTAVRLAPYSLAYATKEEDFRELGFVLLTEERWDHFGDFDYLASGKQSPNLSVIPPSERRCFTFDWQ